MPKESRAGGTAPNGGAAEKQVGGTADGPGEGPPQKHSLTFDKGAKAMPGSKEFAEQPVLELGFVKKINK